MVYKWYEDKDKMISFMRALENRIKMDDVGYDITIDSWHWSTGGKKKHAYKLLFFTGNMSGDLSYSHNFRAEDDFDVDTEEIDVEINIGGYEEKDILAVSKQEFFKMVVDDIHKEIATQEEVLRELLTEGDDDNWGNADNWRDD